MKGEFVRLAVKDFQIQAKSAKNYAITLLVFLAVFLLMNPMQYHMALSMAALITLYRFINSTMYEDEKNNTLRLIDSLPVGRETVVKARYLSTGILAVALLIILGVVTAIIDRAYGNDSAGLAICMFLFYVILMSVYMPIGFRLGYIKAVNINRFIFLGIFMIFGFFSALMGNLARQQGPDPAEGSIMLPADMSPVLVMALFAVVTFLLYIVSMKVSVVFYKKRELF
ncbi:MAG TPA: ABC-2 transporter permease [Clostridiales bacterium]|nr:ABC-2 transporter permease [Clostridiales bacterium]HPV02112.1 ABC-2 transporter permease [Clostridiales bacterium]